MTTEQSTRRDIKQILVGVIILALATVLTMGLMLKQSLDVNSRLGHDARCRAITAAADGAALDDTVLALMNAKGPLTPEQRTQLTVNLQTARDQRASAADKGCG